MRLLIAAVVPLCALNAQAQIEAARALFENEEYASAYSLFKPIAEQGGAEAQYRMGIMHKFGWGTQRDHATAAKWLRLAAEQSYPEAQSELASYYKDGRGVARDLRQAAQWFRKAAEQGVGIAQLNPGRLYKNGNGVATDLVEAYVWFTLAARNNDMDGLSYRGAITPEMSAADIEHAEVRLKAYAATGGK
jgi:TPR repeat protein